MVSIRCIRKGSQRQGQRVEYGPWRNPVSLLDDLKGGDSNSIWPLNYDECGTLSVFLFIVLVFPISVHGPQIFNV